MACIGLHIDNPANRFVLKTMLSAEGHQIVEKNAAVVFTDQPDWAIEHTAPGPVILLTPTSQIEAAIEAMRQGVYGYILLPFQPGEAPLMVDRALRLPDHPPESEDSLPALRELERKHILKVLAHCNNNHSRAAKILGIGRNTLWRKLKQYDTETPKAEFSSSS